MLFAWTVCRRVRSNAIVIAKDGATLGIGAGQMSRVDSVRLAVEKCRDARGEEADGLLAGSALASDAFFPFADGPEAAIEAGAPRSSSPAAPSATPTWSTPATPPASRWSSPSTATSGTSRKCVQQILICPLRVRTTFFLWPCLRIWAVTRALTT